MLSSPVSFSYTCCSWFWLAWWGGKLKFSRCFVICVHLNLVRVDWVSWLNPVAAYLGCPEPDTVVTFHHSIESIWMGALWNLQNKGINITRLSATLLSQNLMLMYAVQKSNKNYIKAMVMQSAKMRVCIVFFSNAAALLYTMFLKTILWITLYYLPVQRKSWWGKSEP